MAARSESTLRASADRKADKAALSDAESLVAVHELAWRSAYLGMKLIFRRRTERREGAIRKGSRISILAFGGTVAGYTNYGRKGREAWLMTGKSRSFTFARNSSGGLWTPLV
jgi:hypothetical protein